MNLEILSRIVHGLFGMTDRVYTVSRTYGLRPVFTLNEGLKVTGGNGEETSPYTLGI